MDGFKRVTGHEADPQRLQTGGPKSALSKVEDFYASLYGKGLVALAILGPIGLGYWAYQGGSPCKVKEEPVPTTEDFSACSQGPNAF